MHTRVQRLFSFKNCQLLFSFLFSLSPTKPNAAHVRLCPFYGEDFRAVFLSPARRFPLLALLGFAGIIYVINAYSHTFQNERTVVMSLAAKQIFFRIVAIFTVVVTLPLAVLTNGLDAITRSERPQEISMQNVVGAGAYFRSQGITNDGEHFYFSAKTSILRTEADGVTHDLCNFSAIPDELAENYGIAHIGGLSYYDGKIYAGLEDSKVWDYPIVGVYDAETLELTDYYILDCEVVTRGLPWVAVNPENGYLYCTDHSKNPTKLLAYDVNNAMEFVGEVTLAESTYAIQGGEFYNGTLYCATNDDTQAIYAVNVTDGTVEKVLDRNLTGLSEGEGMTIVTKNGEDMICAIDMGTIYINAHIRYFEFPNK